MISAVPCDSEEARRLLAALDEDLLRRYPEDAIHRLHPGEGEDPGVTFLIARVDGRAAGCGALRRLDPDVGEIKRMFVVPEFRGRGIARRILAALESEARRAGHSRVRLETGTRQPEAIALYRSAGYAEIPAFGEYVGNHFSVCFEKSMAQPV